MICQNTRIQTHLPTLLDSAHKEKDEIRIRKGECQKYLICPDRDGVYERAIFVEEGAIFRGAGIVLGANMVLKMSVFLEGNHSEASLQLLGLATPGSNLEISGIGNARKGIQQVKLRIDQTNILLGKAKKVRGMPILEVETDSIEGGHSCKIHKISGEALFYLQSHGIDELSAQKLLLEGEIFRHAEVLGEEKESFKDHILDRLNVLTSRALGA